MVHTNKVQNKPRKKTCKKKDGRRFFSGEDLDVIFAVIDEDLLSGDPEEPHKAPTANNTLIASFV